MIFSGSYGNNRSNGNSLLDDLDSFDVGPLRPGPAVIKNFYVESPLVANRAPVQSNLLHFIAMKKKFSFNSI